jgi:hypothetical protein
MSRVETKEPKPNQTLRRPGQRDPNLVMLLLNRSVIQRSCSGLIWRPANQDGGVTASVVDPK